MFSQAGEYGMGAKGFTDTQMLPMKVAYSDLTPLPLKSPRRAEAHAHAVQDACHAACS